ncbi:MAG: HD domain-containing protein [bacterium]|nr:HD domain-containing protein [bacterium]
MTGEGGEISPRISTIDRPIPRPEILPSRAELERYRQKPEWYETHSNQEHAKSKVHGSGHHARTLVWTGYQANLLPADEQAKINKEALFWAATTHDLGRTGNFELRELRNFPHHQKAHEERGGEWIRNNWQLLDPNLSPETVEMIAYLVGHHGDHGEKMAGAPTELRLLIGADHLEGTRVIRGVDPMRRHLPARLRPFFKPMSNALRNVIRNRTDSEEVVKLLPIARQFAAKSHQHPNYETYPYTAVFDVAQKMQLIGD